MRALYERVEAALAGQPAATAVTAASVAVLTGSSQGARVMVEGFEAGPDTNRVTRLNQVGTDYFRALGIPLLAGRTFTELDARGSPPVAIVNETFARKFNLGRDALGRRLARGGLDAAPDTEIVGLVADTRYDNPKYPEPPILYVPYRQEESVGSLTFYVRSVLPADGMLRTIPALMAELDPNLPVTALTTLQRQAQEVNFADRAITLLSTAFAALATLLAAIGLYGVLAYAVAQRTRELGLRMALGADAARLRAMVLGQVGRITLVGGALGLVAALGLARAARWMLYEVEGLPPAVVAAAVSALAAVGPGRRARPRAPGGARRPDGGAAGTGRP